MAFAIGRHPGAAWLKLDLQCHTPRDRNWTGSPHLPGGDPDREAARDIWADNFVQEAVRRGLDGVAVTDHHDAVFLPYIMRAVRRAASSKPFSVFPGIEVTCEDRVQCLVIGAPDMPLERLERMLNKLTKVRTSDPITAMMDPVQTCGLSLSEVIDQISRDEELSNELVVIPHFSNRGAHKSLNQEGNGAKFAAIPCDGVYIECAKEDLDGPTIDKIQGRVKEWGERRRAIVATGDNRTANFARLGKNDCWIRLGERTIEALRQSFLADEARISFVEPTYPENRIISMAVRSSITGPEPISMLLSDGFTAFIGGRGSGKSAMLEFMRFGLGKSELDIHSINGTSRDQRDREKKLVEETLKSGWVSLEVERGGVREVWTRHGHSSQTINIESAGGSEKINIAMAEQRFPARAFHQKELSTTMLHSERAADSITEIAAAEVVEERRLIERDLISAKRKVATALQNVAAYWQAEVELRNARSTVIDVKRRIAAVGAQLIEVGVQESDLMIVNDASRFGRAQNFIADVKVQVDRDFLTLANFDGDMTRMKFSQYEDAFTFPHVRLLREKIVSARQKIGAAVADIASLLEGLGIAQKATNDAFVVDQTEFETLYQSAKDRQSTHRSLISEAESLARRLQDAEAEENHTSAKERRLSVAVDEFDLARQELSQLVSRRYQLLEKASEQVIIRSNGTLDANVKRDRKPTEYISAMCSWMEGSLIRNYTESCAGWVEKICRDGGIGWAATLDKIIDMYRLKVHAGPSAETSPDAIFALENLVFDREERFTHGQMARLYHKLNDQVIGVMLSAVPRDYIALTYVNGRQRIDFRKASPGQQASALLTLLLQQEAGTLIIDQPEDDLDNRVIMSIVNRIRTSKSLRQIIFATHNPNFVVNGDADKVISMRARVAEDRLADDSALVHIDVDGAIETPKVREAITRVMEGGLPAFDLRARKYSVEGAQRI